MPAEVFLSSLTEKQFLQLVKDAARLRGWRVYHTFDSRRSDPGFPDLVLLRKGQLLFLELKRTKGKVRPEQQGWIDELNGVISVKALIARPEDWEELHTRLA